MCNVELKQWGNSLAIRLPKTILSKAMQNGEQLAQKLDDAARHASVNKLTNDLKGFSTANNDAKVEKLNNWVGDYLMLCVKANVPAFSDITTIVDAEDKIKLANAITSQLTGKVE
ncbi:hypothetical protein [Lactobacillus crispatus]|uniref:AbrB/MazE/SpoVT family DNA-binding domain-containing protein n=1 Tax=Lactobacillus crispatus TaxID=47770 RepID=UPI0030F8FC0C